MTVDCFTRHVVALQDVPMAMDNVSDVKEGRKLLFAFLALTCIISYANFGDVATDLSNILQSVRESFSLSDTSTLGGAANKVSDLLNLK